MATCFGRIAAIFRPRTTNLSHLILCVIVVVYDVNLCIIIIVRQRDGFHKVNEREEKVVEQHN